MCNLLRSPLRLWCAGRDSSVSTRGRPSACVSSQDSKTRVGTYFRVAEGLVALAATVALRLAAGFDDRDALAVLVEFWGGEQADTGSLSRLFGLGRHGWSACAVSPRARLYTTSKCCWSRNLVHAWFTRNAFISSSSLLTSGLLDGGSPYKYAANPDWVRVRDGNDRLKGTYNNCRGLAGSCVIFHTGPWYVDVDGGREDIYVSWLFGATFFCSCLALPKRTVLFHTADGNEVIVGSSESLG